MSDYGIKVTKPNKAVSSTDIRDWVLHSDYSMFKYHSTLTGQITIGPGSSTGSLEVNHNLGYVPAFLVYQDGMLFPSGIKAYATTTKIHIDRTLSSPYDQTSIHLLAEEAYWENTIIGYHVIAGRDNSFGGSMGSAIRFINVNVPQGKTLVSAQIHYTLGTVSDGDVYFWVYGIDEDNTASFSSNPMGRTETTAANSKTQTHIDTFFDWSDMVTSIAQEIVNRPGWSSGNAMGFKLKDRNSDDGDKLITRHTDNFTLNEITLDIVYNGTNSEVTNYKVIVFKDKIA